MTTQAVAQAANRYGLAVGTPEIRSIGPVGFGPEGILFFADNAQASIFAVALDDDAAPAARPLAVEQLDTRLAAYLGCAPEDVSIRGMAVHPLVQTVYLAVQRGSGDAALPALIRVAGDGSLSVVSLEQAPFARLSLDDAPAADDPRQEVRVVPIDGPDGELIEPRSGFRLRIARDSLRTVTVTDLAYVDGLLLVAGACNEEFSSALRRIPFPFTGETRTNSIEIYHVSHGRYETASPIRTFVPFGGNTSLLASYTCTPIVQFSLQDLASGTLLKGRTVAELGAGNTPIDMIAYTDAGQEYLLVSNARHPLMKIPCAAIAGQEGLTQPREPVGVPRETLPHEGVGLMAARGDGEVLMLQRDAEGRHLRSYGSASL
ncbi:MAG TPA: hypothetical protein VKV26_04935 [Dehalococcoidia bacterium]|nr:hypothetical protein [Dehalococcoidia bacterium]